MSIIQITHLSDAFQVELGHVIGTFDKFNSEKIQCIGPCFKFSPHSQVLAPKARVKYTSLPMVHNDVYDYLEYYCNCLKETAVLNHYPFIFSMNNDHTGDILIFGSLINSLLEASMLTPITDMEDYLSKLLDPNISKLSVLPSDVQKADILKGHLSNDDYNKDINILEKDLSILRNRIKIAKLLSQNLLNLDIQAAGYITPKAEYVYNLGVRLLESIYRFSIPYFPHNMSALNINLNEKDLSLGLSHSPYSIAPMIYGGNTGPLIWSGLDYIISQLSAIWTHSLNELKENNNQIYQEVLANIEEINEGSVDNIAQVEASIASEIITSESQSAIEDISTSQTKVEGGNLDRPEIANIEDKSNNDIQEINIPTSETKTQNKHFISLLDNVDNNKNKGDFINRITQKLNTIDTQSYAIAGAIAIAFMIIILLMYSFRAKTSYKTKSINTVKSNDNKNI